MADELQRFFHTLLDFEWDETKASSNRAKHGIDFDEAVTVFTDALAITIADPSHSREEARFIDVGLSVRGRLLVVVYTERGDNIRVISCRKATSAERKEYERAT